MREPLRTLPRLEEGDRWFIAGPTGSGKTELGRSSLMANPQRTIYISGKKTFAWDHDNARYSRPAAHSTLELGEQLKEDAANGHLTRCYRLFPPSQDWDRKNIHKIDRVFDWAMTLGNTCVALDDAFRFFGGSSSHQQVEKFTPNYVRAITEGRELKVTVVTIAQRAFNVPIIALSESDVRIAFYLRNPDDQDRMDAYCGDIPWDSLADTDYQFVWATDKSQSVPMSLDLEPALV